MNKLGESIACYKNLGAIFSFWLSLGITIFFVVFALCFNLDDLGKTMALCVTGVMACLTIYMFFKSKTRMDIREHGLYVRTLGKNHEILYHEITGFDKTKRVGKAGNQIVIFYLLVINLKNGEVVTSPCRVSQDFMDTLTQTMNESLS